MTPLLHLVPLALAALAWLALARLNRNKGLVPGGGEVIFWDAVLLVVVFMVGLRWF